MRIKFLQLAVAFIIAASFASCGGGNKEGKLSDINAVEDKSGKVNVIEQAKPALMIIPSDQFLQRSGFLKTRQYNGRTVYDRDYAGFLLNNTTNKDVVRAIQNYFIGQGYPLNDLEQSIKSLNVQENMDDADGVVKDAKTLLVETVRPDIIIEFDYELKNAKVSRTVTEKHIDYSMAALDAFSNKSVASFVKTDIDGNFTTYLENQLPSDMPKFVGQIKEYFKDIVVNGRDITFRVVIDGNSAVNLGDDYNDMGDTYADWIREWVKTNAKNGSANLNRNTNKEMYYTSVRVTNNADDGTQFNAYDFANAFRKEFTKTFQIKSVNTTQGLGDASVMIK